MARVIPRQWINMQTGELTNEALLFLNDLQVGNDPDSPGINTVLAGVNQVQATTDAIIAGTQPLADVLITGVGSVTGAIETQAANVASTSIAASAGALTAYASPVFASATRSGTGSITTNTITVTPAGGTGPYTYAWAFITDDAFTINSPTAATTSFTRLLTNGTSVSADCKCTVTDAALDTFEVAVVVSGFSAEA